MAGEHGSDQPSTEIGSPVGDRPHGSRDGSSDGSRGSPPRSSDGLPHGSGGSPPHARDYSERPLVVTWELTQACRLACDHCRADATTERDPGELSTDEAEALFEQVADFGEPQPFFVFSGGDPLERPDIFELLERATEHGLKPAVTPATTSRLGGDTVERFADIGVRRMAVSIDGATPTAHDTFRGEDGTFEVAVRAARKARSADLPIQVNTTVTAETVDQLPVISDLVEQLGAAMWEVFFLVPVGRGTELSQLSPDRAQEVADWLVERGKQAPYRIITVEAPFYRRVAREKQRADGESPGHVGTTGAGNGFVFVSHTGEVYPSGFLPVSAGNVRDESLVDIYREADLMQRLRDRESFEGPCGSCPATPHCGGSRSRAYATTGSPTGTDPLCPWATDAMGN